MTDSSFDPAWVAGLQASSETETKTPFKVTTTGSIETIALDVGGMKCAGCVKAVERHLEVTGVVSASVNLATEMAAVHYQSGSLDPQDLVQRLTDAGFPSQLRTTEALSIEEIEATEARQYQAAHDRRQQLITAIVLIVLSTIGHGEMLGLEPWPIFTNIWFHYGLATLALLLPGRPILVDGWRGLTHGTANMNTLIGLGVTTAYLASSVAMHVPSRGGDCCFAERVML